MSLSYVIKELGTTKGDEGGSKVYPKAVYNGTVSTEELAEQIAANVSAKASDVKGVLTEFADVMSNQLKLGVILNLEGLGRFYPQIVGTAALESKWNAGTNIERAKVRFLATYTMENGAKVQPLTTGLTAKKYEFTTTDPVA